MMITDDNVEEIFGTMRKAGDAIMRFYSIESIDTQYKIDHSPVTIADTTSNEIICTFLTNKFPDIPIISEEIALVDYEIRKDWEYVWLIDPLDGTKEFLHKSDEFTINLALVRNGSPIAGFIYLPAFKKFYFALKGKGSYEIFNGNKKAIHVNKWSRQQPNVKVVASRSYADKRTEAYINVLDRPEIVKLGSALKFIAIAKGDADYYPRMIHIMEWDTAAGQIIIEEAGGSLVEASTGAPLVYNKVSMINPYFIASGQLI